MLTSLYEVFALPGIPQGVFWGLVAVGVLIQGISKSGFAGGAGVLSLPLMMFVMPPEKVTAVLLLVLILCDFNAIYHHWQNRVWRKVLDIYLPAIAGIALGGLVWWWIGVRGAEHYAVHLKQFTGAIAVLLALYIVAKEASMRWVAHHRAGPRTALACGIAAGFTSTITHGAGPIVNLYLFSQGLGKTLFVGTVAWTFTFINLTKLPIFLGVGLIDRQVLLFDLVLIPLIPLGSWLGHWMHHRVPERPFNLTIMALTLLAGVQLLLNVQPVTVILRWFSGATG